MRNKDYIVEILDSFSNIQILSMSEKHIYKDIDYGNAFHVTGYDFMSRKRQTGYRGGVAAYIHEGINWKRRVDLEDKFIECICLEIFPKKSKSFMAGIIAHGRQRNNYCEECKCQFFE